MLQKGVKRSSPTSKTLRSRASTLSAGALAALRSSLCTACSVFQVVDEALVPRSADVSPSKSPPDRAVIPASRVVQTMEFVGQGRRSDGHSIASQTWQTGLRQTATFLRTDLPAWMR